MISGSPAMLALSVRSIWYLFVSFRLFSLKSSVNLLNSVVSLRYSSLASPSRLAPCRTKLLYAFSSNWLCSCVSCKVSFWSYTSFTRANSFSFSVILLLCSLSNGIIFWASSCRSSFVSALSILPKTETTLSSSSPDSSNASIVLLKFAFSGFSMIASISAFCCLIPSRIAGS